MILALLRAIRPRQWVKNLFVGAPVLFAQRLTDGVAALRAAEAVGVFCLVSSAVYLWNDLVDVEKDRAHPRKRERPIASGALPMDAAKGFAAAFATVGLALGYLIAPRFAAVAGGYLALNVAYSLALKRVPYVDVLVIASGFLLRVVAGAIAVGVEASPWLLLCTGLLASCLGFGKRAHELATAGARALEQRAVLRAYHPSLLRGALYATGVATIGAYFAYAVADHTRAFFHTDKMVWTLPFAVVGVGRYLMLVSSRPRAESPTEEMLRDPLFIANLAVYTAAVFAVIYLGRG